MKRNSIRRRMTAFLLSVVTAFGSLPASPALAEPEEDVIADASDEEAVFETAGQTVTEDVIKGDKKFLIKDAELKDGMINLVSSKDPQRFGIKAVSGNKPYEWVFFEGQGDIIYPVLTEEEPIEPVVDNEGYILIELCGKPEAGYYSAFAGAVSDNEADCFEKEYTVSVNLAPAGIEITNDKLVITDTDNMEEGVYYVISGNILDKKELIENIDGMAEVSDGMSVNELLDRYDFINPEAPLYMYTVNKRTQSWYPEYDDAPYPVPDDILVDDRGWYAADGYAEFTIELKKEEPISENEAEKEPVSENNAKVYQVSGNEIIATGAKSGQKLNVAVITGENTDGTYKTASANKVTVDEDGNIAIAKEWLAEDIQISAGDDNAFDTVNLPIVKFIDEKLAFDINVPKAGSSIDMTASCNVAGIGADISWSGVKADGSAVSVKAGDKFIQGVEYRALFDVSITEGKKSVLEPQLELVQFMHDYDKMPEAYGAELSAFTAEKDPIVRNDEKAAGCSNFTGFSFTAEYGAAKEHLAIESIVIEDWKDIVWTENTGKANSTVFAGTVCPRNADEKLVIKTVDTISGNEVIAAAYENKAAPSDQVVSGYIYEKAEDAPNFTLTILGSDVKYRAGFATLHPDTENGGNKAVIALGDILVTVKYSDVTGVSVNNIFTTKDDGSKFSSMSVTGLIPLEMYAVDFSISGNNAKNWTRVFTANANGEIVDKEFKNVNFTINRTSEKEQLYRSDEKAYAAFKTYTEIVGNAQSFNTEDTAAEPSRGLFYVIENEDDIVYTGSKITPVVHVYEGDRELVEGQDFTVSYKNNLNAGDAKAVVKGKNGSNVERKDLIFKIQQADIADATVVTVQSVKGKAGAQPIVIYNGIKMAQKKSFVKIAKDSLKNLDQNTPKVVELTGTGNFKGKTTFCVIGVNKKVKLNARLSTKKFAYAGHYKFVSENVINAVVFKKGDKETAEFVLPDEDPNFAMGNAGSYKLGIVGHGEYEGACSFLKFSITPVKSANFHLNVNAVDYDPRGITFEEGEYTLTGVGDENLIRGMDYTMSYSKNKKAGTAKVTVTFKGSYKGTKKARSTFAINKADIAKAADLIFAAPVANEKKAKKNTVYVSQNGVLLKKGKKADYVTEYMGIADGEATLKVRGTGNYTGAVDVKFKVKDGVADFTKAKVKAGKGQKFIYNGSYFTNDAEGENKVNVEVTKVTSASVQYYFFNNLNKGKAVVVVCGDGENSTGSKATKFTIKGSKAINDEN